MIQLTLNNDLPKSKMASLLNFLKAEKIEAKIQNIDDGEISDYTLLTESALAKEWLNKEEDQAWKNL
jgi:hypothetical protein